jgi:uncharacterized protein
MEEQVVDAASRSRFELQIDDLTCFADYRIDGERLIVTHVEAPPVLRGTGAAGRLMEGLLAIARSKGQKIVPLCGYASAYIRRHAEHRDLLA